MSENKKINENENPILTDTLTPVKKPRKTRQKKLVENGILDESVIPEEAIPKDTEKAKTDSAVSSKEINSSEKKEPQTTSVSGTPVSETPVSETPVSETPVPDEGKKETSNEQEGPAVISAPTFKEKCKTFYEKQKPFWSRPLTVGKAVIIALVAVLISTSVSCAGIAKVNDRLDSLENSSELSSAYLEWIMSPFGAAETQIQSGKRLGITVQDTNDGVVVVGVEDGTSAAKRFKLDDVIVLCNGAPVKTADDILSIVQNLPDDEKSVEFSVNREGKIKTFQVALEK